jgi:glycosyltransferase involved in cell wall biosynthesis
MAARPVGHELVLLVDRDPEPGILPSGCTIINAAPRRTVTSSAVAGDRRSLRDMWAFTRAARRLNPDVFFFPAVYSFFPVPRRLPTVVCFHDTIAESFPELVFGNWRNRLAWRMKVWLALRRANRLMTVSKASRDSLATRFRVPSERIDVVTEAPSPVFQVLDDWQRIDDVLQRTEVPRDRRYLLHVGAISPHKNLLALLNAMALALDTHDATLVLVGDLDADGFLANFAELERKVSATPRLQTNCVFTGRVSDDDLVSLYNAAWALVFPSLSEGFGLPAVEAMACGVPVLASRAGSLPEVVGPAGLYFDPTDVEDMAAQIKRILSEPSLREDLARRALMRSREFSWDRAAELAFTSLEKATQ